MIERSCYFSNVTSTVFSTKAIGILEREPKHAGRLVVRLYGRSRASQRMFHPVFFGARRERRARTQNGAGGPKYISTGEKDVNSS